MNRISLKAKDQGPQYEELSKLMQANKQSVALKGKVSQQNMMSQFSNRFKQHYVKNGLKRLV